MKKTMTTSEAVWELLADEYANWTSAGAEALITYLEELEEDIGEDIEFDRVALRCDFWESSSLFEWVESYTGRALSAGLDMLGIEAAEDTLSTSEKIREYIHERGVLIEFQGGVIVSSF